MVNTGMNIEKFPIKLLNCAALEFIWGPMNAIFFLIIVCMVHQNQSTLSKNAEHQFYFKIAHLEARKLFVLHLDPYVCLLHFLGDTTWRAHRALSHLQPVQRAVTHGKHLCDYWVVSQTGHSVHGTPLSVQSTTDKLSAQTWALGGCVLHSEVGRSLHWQHLLPRGAFKLQLKFKMLENSFPQWAWQLPNSSGFFLMRSVVILTTASKLHNEEC